MENNEIMITEVFENMGDTIVADEESGIGTGMAVLIGAGLALAVGGAVKAGKWAFAKLKAKKELRQPDKEIIIDPDEIEELAS
jgi:hypothetical protein